MVSGTKGQGFDSLRGHQNESRARAKARALLSFTRLFVSSAG